MTATYAKPEDVKRILQRGGFDQESEITFDEVEKTIERYEYFIDKAVNTSWKENIVENEYHDIPTGSYDWSVGRSIKLLYRDIRSIDKLEVWNGSSWEDWVEGSQTESRNGDYWVDYGGGFLYLKLRYAFHWKQAVRVSYTYGKTSVTPDIRDATALLTAAELITGDDYTMVASDTGDPVRMTHDNRVSRWVRTARQIINNYNEILVL